MSPLQETDARHYSTNFRLGVGVGAQWPTKQGTVDWAELNGELVICRNNITPYSFSSCLKIHPSPGAFTTVVPSTVVDGET